jgi:hypothetical protein
VDPQESAEETETVTMTIEASEGGTAVVRITEGLFYELNSTTEGYEVIVRKGDQEAVDTEITFSAESSTDPVGDVTLANFTWDFGDGLPANGSVDYGSTTTHNYTSSGEFTVNLTISETGGNMSWRDVIVHVDGLDPVADIQVNTSDANVTLNGTKLTVNEDLNLVFDGESSYDDLTAANDKDGIIDKWYWVWGDGTANNTVTSDDDNEINHTFSTPGIYYLNMAVTDIVGHESSYDNWTVTVKDITPPVILDISIFNSTMSEVQGCIENETFYFGANNTVDEFDEYEDLDFTWEFEKMGEILFTSTDGWTNYTFTAIGDVNVTLYAEDSAGNEANYTKIVNCMLGDRPDLELQSLTWTFDAEEGSVGKALTISVNITNNGHVDATNVEVTFNVRNADGTDDELTGTLTMTSNGTTDDGIIEPHEIVTASFVWKPSTKGTYTLWANCSTPDEHSSQLSDNNNIGDFQEIVVKEAGWVIPAIIGAVIAVLLAVFFGTRYFMRMRTEPDFDRKEKRKK